MNNSRSKVTLKKLVMIVFAGGVFLLTLSGCGDDEDRMVPNQTSQH